MQSSNRSSELFDRSLEQNLYTTESYPSSIPDRVVSSPLEALPSVSQPPQEASRAVTWATTHGEVAQETRSENPAPTTGAAATPNDASSYLERIQEFRQLSENAPAWFDGLKTAVLMHCFGPDFASVSRVGDVTEQDVNEFVTALNPPPYLTAHQRMLLSELLQNVEAWWSSSFGVMQSIHEESAQLIGFNALPVPPTPLPLQIQHRLKTIVRSVMQLLRIPQASGSGKTEAGEQSMPLGPDDVRYWTMLGQEHRTNPKLVLREWLFQHFDRPYPTDQDKQLLATVTGLSRMQVSNWFINARVRIWQPMVVELGKELDYGAELGEIPEEVPASLGNPKMHQELLRGNVLGDHDPMRVPPLMSQPPGLPTFRPEIPTRPLLLNPVTTPAGAIPPKDT